jgi:hypothetical protein
MTLFQTIVVPLFVLLFLERLNALRHGRAGRGLALMWAAVWLGAAVAVAFPGLTSAIGTFLGIGRGADLVLYCGIIAMFLGFFSVYVRMRRIEAQLTELVRQIAIANPRWPESTT